MAVSASKYQIGQTGTFANTVPINGDLYPITGPIYLCSTDQYYYRLQTSVSGANITATVLAVDSSFVVLSQT